MLAPFCLSKGTVLDFCDIGSSCCKLSLGSNICHSLWSVGSRIVSHSMLSLFKFAYICLFYIVLLCSQVHWKTFYSLGSGFTHRQWQGAQLKTTSQYQSLLMHSSLSAQANFTLLAHFPPTVRSPAFITVLSWLFRPVCFLILQSVKQVCGI